jgi:hypothetical protein
MSNDKLNGRKIYIPIGREPREDLCILSDCIAESRADLFNDQNECVIWIAAGRRVNVGPDILREVCRLYVVTKHVREIAEGFVVEYRPLDPDEMILRKLLSSKTTRDDGGLLWRLPQTQRVLSKHQRQEIDYRLGRGERVDVVARSIGTDVATLQQLLAS